MIDRINELAKNRGISISAIEKNLGLSNGLIGKWKKQSPSCDKLKLVADYFNVSIDYLLTGKEYQSNTNDSFNNNIAYGDNSKVQLNSNNNDEDEIYTELSKIVKSLPLKERSKLITMIYDFQEQYSKNGIASVPHLTDPSTPNSPVISQNEQKLLDVFKHFNDYEQVKIIGRIEDWLDAKHKRQVANQQQIDNVSGVPQPEESPTIQQSKPWRLTARRTNGVYESRLATPEEVAKLKELLENNPEEPEY